jgi:PAS domain S-box-containing protein
VFTILRVKKRQIFRRKFELEDMVGKQTAALRESGEKYRTVVESADRGIAIIQDKIIVFHNNRFGKLLGISDKYIINHPIIQFVIPQKQLELKTILTLRGGDKEINGNFESTLLHKDGEQIHVKVNYGIITYKKRSAFLMFFHDIRMQKLLEEERMKTVKLESTRMLARGIAHDFNNLLSIIIGNIELTVTELTSDSNLFQSLHKAQAAGLKAADLIQQFIMLSKDGSLLKKPEFIQEIIKDAVNQELKSTEITCHFHLSESLWPTECNLLQIKQALTSIVSNARQAMPDKGVLEVRAENKELTADQIMDNRAGKFIEISIVDNGTGILHNHLPRIFDPYFSTKKNVTQKGLGLGLAIVHSIINRHDGFLNITSEVGVGTTVLIYLPATIKVPNEH